MVLISIYMCVTFFSHEIKMTKCFCFVLPIENADDEFSELGEWRHYDLANVNRSKSGRKMFRRRFVSGTILVSPCTLERYFQSKMKIEPDLRLNQSDMFLILGCESSSFMC